jgi:hypothetical protein
LSSWRARKGRRALPPECVVCPTVSTISGVPTPVPPRTKMHCGSVRGVWPAAASAPQVTESPRVVHRHAARIARPRRPATRTNTARRSPSRRASTEAICASRPNRQRPGPDMLSVRKMWGQRQESLDSSSMNRQGNRGAVSGGASVAKPYTSAPLRTAGNPLPPHLSPTVPPPCPHRVPPPCPKSDLPLANLGVFGVSKALWPGSNVNKLSL